MRSFLAVLCLLAGASMISAAGLPVGVALVLIGAKLATMRSIPDGDRPIAWMMLAGAAGAALQVMQYLADRA